MKYSIRAVLLIFILAGIAVPPCVFAHDPASKALVAQKLVWEEPAAPEPGMEPVPEPGSEPVVTPEPDTEPGPDQNSEPAPEPEPAQ